MSDDKYTELLHSNLDSPELRIETEKRVCQQIETAHNNRSVYIVAIFDYCINRSADKWPSNAIKSIAGLDPDLILNFFEVQIEQFSEQRSNMEHSLHFLQLLFCSEKDRGINLWSSCFVRSATFEKILSSRVLVPVLKAEFLKSIFYTIDSPTMEAFLDTTISFFFSQLQNSESFRDLWFHIYAFDPDRALDRLKRTVDFPVEWTNLPLHPKYYSIHKTFDNFQKSKFIANCHKIQIQDDILKEHPYREQKLEALLTDSCFPAADFEEDSDLEINRIYLKYQLERFERRILMEEMIQSDRFKSNCSKLQNQIEILNQKLSMNSNLYNSKIEIQETENLHLNNVVKRQNEKIKHLETKNAKINSKINNLTEINNQLEEKLAKNKCSKVTNDGYNDLLKSSQEKDEGMKKLEEKLGILKQQIETKEIFYNSKELTFEGILTEKTERLAAYSSDLEKSKKENGEMILNLKHLKNSNDNLRKVLREKEERIDLHKLDMKNKSKNSSAKVKCLEEANRSQLQIIQRLQQEIVRLTTLQALGGVERRQPVEMSQSQPKTIRANRDDR